MLSFFYSFCLATGFIGLSQLCRKRWLLWPAMLLIVAAVHFLHIDDGPFSRMVAICAVLLICMKGIVLAEWGGRLTSVRKLIFIFLWFGMDPTPFAARKRRLTWKKDAYVGLACFLVGLFLSVPVAYLGTDLILVMFVPLSIAFHYGLLRLLTAFWRLQGIAVRPLFRNPLVCRGLADFWSKRWNLSFSQMMARTVKRPLEQKVGNRISLFAVFFFSGFLHELAITLPVQSGYGLPTLYFAMHGVVVLFEKESWPVWPKRLLALILVALPLPILFLPVFPEEVIRFTLIHLKIF